MGSRTKEVDRAIRVYFDTAIETAERFTYDDWEAGFIRRWHMHPNDRSVSRFYLNQRQEIGLLSLIAAARAFHVSEFTGDVSVMPRRILAYERDFDKVPPEQIEDELTTKQEDEIATQLEHDERLGRPGRTIFDMGRGQHD